MGREHMGSATGAAVVTFYTRDQCHLCHQALAIIEELQLTQPFELVVVDLDRQASPDKLAAYDHEVPVVELQGRKIMKYTVDPARLSRLLMLA